MHVVTFAAENVTLPWPLNLEFVVLLLLLSSSETWFHILDYSSFKLAFTNNSKKPKSKTYSLVLRL